MSAHTIEITAYAIHVTGPRRDDLDVLTEQYGSYRRREGRYEFPRAIEAQIRTILDGAGAPKAKTGWSKAARRRAGRHGGTGRSHPLGTVTYRGDGFTEYSDDSFGGGGVVQIWDES
jgi:hypothetical protein